MGQSETRDVIDSKEFPGHHTLCVTESESVISV